MDKPTNHYTFITTRNLVHIISILNITRYDTQVNRHSIYTLMDAARATSRDINNLYNLTTSVTTSINFHQLILHIRSVLLTFMIHSTTSEQFLHIPWTILMQPYQEHSLLMSYQLWTYKGCCHT